MYALDLLMCIIEFLSATPVSAAHFSDQLISLISSPAPPPLVNQFITMATLQCCRSVLTGRARMSKACDDIKHTHTQTDTYTHVWTHTHRKQQRKNISQNIQWHKNSCLCTSAAEQTQTEWNVRTDKQTLNWTHFSRKRVDLPSTEKDGLTGCSWSDRADFKITTAHVLLCWSVSRSPWREKKQRWLSRCEVKC